MVQYSTKEDGTDYKCGLSLMQWYSGCIRYLIEKSKQEKEGWSLLAQTYLFQWQCGLSTTVFNWEKADVMADNTCGLCFWEWHHWWH